jgi:transcriptional regulator with XRE-family HTH domain
MRTALGKALAKARIDRDEDSGEMAEKLGLTKSYMSRLEYGDTLMSPALACRIHTEYGIDVGPLLMETTGEITIDLSLLSEADRKVAMGLCLKQWNIQVPEGIWGGAPATAQKVATPVATKAPPPAVPDVDGVGFIDDDIDDEDLEGLD